MKLAEDFTYLIMKVTQNGAKYRTPQLGRDLKGASFGVSLHAVELSLGSFSWGPSVTGSAPPCGRQRFPSLGACKCSKTLPCKLALIQLKRNASMWTIFNPVFCCRHQQLTR